MRIDGYYNREPIGLSDNPEEATFFCPCNHTFGCVYSLLMGAINNGSDAKLKMQRINLLT